MDYEMEIYQLHRRVKELEMTAAHNTSLYEEITAGKLDDDSLFGRLKNRQEEQAKWITTVEQKTGELDTRINNQKHKIAGLAASAHNAACRLGKLESKTGSQEHGLSSAISLVHNICRRLTKLEGAEAKPGNVEETNRQIQAYDTNIRENALRELQQKVEWRLSLVRRDLESGTYKTQWAKGFFEGGKAAFETVLLYVNRIKDRT